MVLRHPGVTIGIHRIGGGGRAKILAENSAARRFVQKSQSVHRQDRALGFEHPHPSGRSLTQPHRTLRQRHGFLQCRRRNRAVVLCPRRSGIVLLSWNNRLTGTWPGRKPNHGGMSGQHGSAANNKQYHRNASKQHRQGSRRKPRRSKENPASSKRINPASRSQVPRPIKRKAKASKTTKPPITHHR